MNRLLLFVLFVMSSLVAVAQGSVKGKVIEKQTTEPLQFVNIAVQTLQGKLVKGAITDVNGQFNIAGLKDGQYQLQVSYVGYKPLIRKFALSPQQRQVHFAALYIAEDSRTLKEVQVVGQRSQMKLEVDRKTFTVDQIVAAAGGSASDLLENIPSVEVTTDGEISLRGNSSVEVWINGKASGLTSDNRGEILQQIPAESIEKIEVIDNPSAKYSPEGSAGIINIVLKRDRKAGYYGSIQTGVNNHKGYNIGGNINYSSKWVDAFANLGHRRRRGSGGNLSEQKYPLNDEYLYSDGDNDNNGRGLFARAGLTFHLSKNDDLSVSGMTLHGNHSNDNLTTYRYGAISTGVDNRILRRQTVGDGDMEMYHGELGYEHKFSDNHKLNFVFSADQWKNDGSNAYLNDTTNLGTHEVHTYSYQYRPMKINNRAMEVKVDYENQLTEHFKLEAGYNGRFSHENTPQESWDAVNPTTLNPIPTDLEEDRYFYNRFIYDIDVHALYATVNTKVGKLGVMAGLRGEYWKVNTESYSWEQQYDVSLRDAPFKKDYFQLFPSLFLNYQLTESAQLQLNYTRRLRRPWGGQLNSFKNTRDASVISFGNPLLTPEYTNSFSLNFLKTWRDHTLSVGTYYRPTTDVIQRIRYQGVHPTTGAPAMFTTNENVAKSQSAGIEIIGKNKLFRILDLTTTLNGYYYKLDGFSYVIDGQTVTGESNENFSWDARLLASVILPYSISVQATGNMRSRSVITQGYRKSNGSLDLGIRKTFFNRTLAFAFNWRDVFKTRHWENYTSGPTFWRHQRNWRDPRINLQVTWNFGNMNKKRPGRDDMQQGAEDDMQQDYTSGGSFD